MYINGPFCYAFKFGIITNGLGIVRDITFYNKEFLEAHPDIILEKKSDFPNDDKSLADSKALISILKDLFKKNPLVNPKTFLYDAAFDSIKIYKNLLQETSVKKAYIPLNNKFKIKGVTTALMKKALPAAQMILPCQMKREGSKSHLRCWIPTMKFV